MLKIYQQLIDLVLKIVGGKGLGKKFPFLWRLYDFFFRLAAPKKYFFHQINNMKFLVDPNEPLRHVRNWMQNYFMSNEYEPVTTKIVEELVKPGHIAIDIGASIGYFSMLLSRCVGVSGRTGALSSGSWGRTVMYDVDDTSATYQLQGWCNGGETRIGYQNTGEDNTVDGCIEFVDGVTDLMGLQMGTYRHTPKVGELFLFPSNLLHTVYPFKSEVTRISMSFNVMGVSYGKGGKHND